MTAELIKFTNKEYKTLFQYPDNFKPKSKISNRKVSSVYKPSSTATTISTNTSASNDPKLSFSPSIASRLIKTYNRGNTAVANMSMIEERMNQLKSDSTQSLKNMLNTQMKREQFNGTPQSQNRSQLQNKQEFFVFTPKPFFKNQIMSTENKPHGINIDNLESIELIKVNRNLKSKVYSSYLIYNSANPFSSNFDLINKNNPEFYEALSKTNGQLNASYRFNRANSTLSLLNNYMDQKKFESYLFEEKKNNNENIVNNNNEDLTGKLSPVTNQNNDGRNSLAFPVVDEITMKVVSNNNKSVHSEKKDPEQISVSGRKTSSNWSLPKKSIKPVMVKPNVNVTQNQFLNYRKKSTSNLSTCKLYYFIFNRMSKNYKL